MAGGWGWHVSRRFLVTVGQLRGPPLSLPNTAVSQPSLLSRSNSLFRPSPA